MKAFDDGSQITEQAVASYVAKSPPRPPRTPAPWTAASANSPS
ncbi:hypothetical protein ACH4GM_29425 [Streptomyces coeruleorubidus]